MRLIAKSGLFVMAAMLCANSYARGPSFTYDKLCTTTNEYINGFVEHVELAPSGDTAKFSFGIRHAAGDNVVYKVNSWPGAGPDTLYGQTMINLLRDAEKSEQRVTVWCSPNGSKSIWIDNDDDDYGDY